MKRSSVLSRPLGAAAVLVLLAAAPLQAQHRHGHTVAATPPTIVEELGSGLTRVEVDRDEHAVDIVVGPLALPHTMAPLRTPIQRIELPVDGWMHGFEWAMVDAAGNPLPDELLHHVNLIDPDRRELFSTTARRVVAAGRETKRQKLPGLIGYPIQSGTRLLVVGMFDNPTDTDYPEAYLRIRLFYGTGGLIDPRSVYPFHMDVMGPVGEKSFPVPPGRTTRSWEGSPAIDIRVLGLGGHLHDYATSLRIEDVTTGKVVWQARPEMDEDGRLIAVPADYVWWKGGIELRRDHTYRVVAEYDNPTDRPIPHGGMGVVGGIALGSEGAWPRFDSRDPDYLEDLRNILAAPHRRGGHGH